MADQAEGEVYEEGEEWDEEGEWDDEAYEEEGWDDEEWDDDDYEDEEDDYEDEEDDLVLQRCAMGGPNRQRNCGIHTIEIYYPQFYFSQLAMEEFDARPDRYGPSVIGKYTKGIGQVEGRFPTDDEDPISFAMTVVHRLLERMEEKGINETGRYQPDGVALNVYNAIGRLDIGTESITDRSKSMKSFVMDIFERYGNGESNIEGVDQYNACYGGQAAGLCAQNWVESDRWDGRYGAAIATDISDAPFQAMFTVGAACTCTLYYPDAPLPHHAHRASCILHRFDFFKPVGWFHMGPVVDGKYSIDAYMSCVDTCYHTLRKKMNDRPLLQITDYNVFHTGGGWHIVKKAFERCIRAENPKILAEERERYIQEKLLCSSNLLKIIGPCHTVSSFLNISSVMMQEWDRALGKVLLVFTYGSGCASSMYQLRFDDIMWMEPLGVWKYKHFYRDSIYMQPDCQIHEVYIATWMKFDYKPMGRKLFGIPYEKYSLDVYYLMEIDKFGRRFFHRGGLKTTRIDKKYRLPVDIEEDRKMRPDYGPVPEEPEESQKSLEEVWRDIEYEMTYDREAEQGNFEEVGEFNDRYNPNQKVTIIRPYPERKRHGTCIEPDGEEHSYQIVGTWNWRWPQDMQRSPDGSWTFEIVLSENRWEEFHLIQDHDPRKRIYPFQERSFKDVPTIGPHDGGHEKLWFLDCRDRMDVSEEQVGMPGDKYLVTFKWQKLKSLTWEKLHGETGPTEPGKYYTYGSWTDWELAELQPEEGKPPGWYSTEVRMTSLGIDFKIVRNEDLTQLIYPLVLSPADLPITQYTRIQGPDALSTNTWKIEDSKMGSVYNLSFFRDPEDCEPTAMKVQWEKVREEPPQEPEPNYYVIGAFNSWGKDGMAKMGRMADKMWVSEVPIHAIALDPNFPEQKRPLMPFKIMMHKMPTRVIHPDKDECTQLMKYTTVMDDESRGSFSWLIGKAPSDKARSGDTFTVRLEIQDDGSYKVTWAKKT
mmetsp:Transcript_120954/g.367808  ORF Transcript_120954/g.367808 Transcript_120954/m.367808 type:complete len:985 (-) Transcript_120954:163-3117(-)